jgi:putative ABC transport system permease protein
MKLADHLRSVRHTFASNRARAALTLLGIMIGAGSIVLLAGLLRGGEEALLRTSQRANEADLIQVRRDDPPTKQQAKTRRNLSGRDADDLAASPAMDRGGRMVTSEMTRESRILFPKKKRVRLVGAAPIALPLYHLEVEVGRFLTAEDLAERRRVCVIGQEVWQQALEAKQPLDGVEVAIEGQMWQVVGVLKNKPLLGGAGDGTWMWNRKVLVPHTTFDAIFSPQHDASRVFVRVGEDGDGSLADRMRAIEGVVKGTLLRRHYGVENFKIEGEEDTEKERLILTIIKMLLLGTGLLSLFVGGINIMNIMLVTVTERTREIGVRRAVGATPGAIMMQFLLEAAFIATTGGVIGVCGGVFLSWLCATVLTHVVGKWSLHVEPWSIVLGLALSLATGVVFGLFPAWRAARLDPVEALRYE